MTNEAAAGAPPPNDPRSTSTAGGVQPNADQEAGARTGSLGRQPTDLGTLDFTETPFALSPAITTEPYSLPKAQEGTRKRIAYALMALLIAISLLPFLMLAANWMDIAALDTLMKIIFAPVIGLVGSVVGFYFGSQSARGDGGSTS